MKVETLIFKNISGKELRYVQISNEFATVNINIGESNFNALNELIKYEKNEKEKKPMAKN